MAGFLFGWVCTWEGSSLVMNNNLLQNMTVQKSARQGARKKRISFFSAVGALLLAVVCPVNSSAQTGPFCPDCTVLPIVHMTDAEWDVLKSDLLNQLIALEYRMSEFRYTADCAYVELNGLSSYLYDLAMNEIISWDVYYSCNTYINNTQNLLFNDIFLKSDEVLYEVQAIETQINNVILTETNVCVSCIATGGGEDDCCLCPDCELALQSLESCIYSLELLLVSIDNNVLSIKGTLESWFTKWQAQDDKLQPLIDELKPMLSNIAHFYDSFYDQTSMYSDYWSQQYDFFYDIKQGDLIAKWGRFFGDYADSTWGSDNWNDLKNVNIAMTQVLNAGEEGFRGRDGFQYLLVDYAVQKDKPYGVLEGVHDVTEEQYKTLNWFQKVAVALGRLAYPTNATTAIEGEGEELATIDAIVNDNIQGVPNKIQDVANACQTLGDKMQIMTTAAAGIMPSGSLPESITITEEKAFGKRFTIGKITFNPQPFSKVFDIFRKLATFIIYLIYAGFLWGYCKYVLRAIYVFSMWVVRAVADYGTQIHNMSQGTVSTYRSDQVGGIFD